MCVVTGAARGLGNLMARTFIESGSNTVAILDLSSDDAEKAASEATQWFEEHGDVERGELNIIGLECNVADEESVQRAMDRVHKHFGKIDVVVNSAGIVENFPAEEYPTDKMKKVSATERVKKGGGGENANLLVLYPCQAHGHQLQRLVLCRERGCQEDVC